MKKISLFLTAGIFLVSGVCLAAGMDPSKIIVPRDSGRIVEVYKSENANAPLIVYLQDIHVNYEAQKAEAAILESLVRDNSFDLIFAEGKPADSNEDFKKLRDNSSKDARMKGAEQLLKDATIPSYYYLDLTTDYKFTIQGIEDYNLYMKETEDHVAIFENKDNMVKLVSTLQNIVSNLKLHVYTKEMRDLDDKMAAYNKDEIGLVEYVKFLQGAAAADSVDIKAYPNTTLFADSSALEGQIDFAAVENERTAATDAISKTLTDPKAKEDFAAKGLKFRTGEISQGEYYTYIKDTAQAAKVDVSTSKNLALYTQYITTYEKIDTNVLFKELDQVVEKTREASIKTPEQKQLSQIDKGLSVISGFVNTKLVPDEYNYYMNNKAMFDFKGWLEFMKNNSTKFALTNPVPDDLKLLADNMPIFERFYGISYDRDNVFIANIKTDIAAAGKDKAVFVCGGFHTPDMKRLLKDNGFSYVIVAPKVDVLKNYESLYIERTKRDLKAFKAANAQAPAQVKQ